MKFYLITGFLGAGKTTFLKNFVRLFQDQKTALLVNEFGKEGVDGTLLSELGVAMKEVNNGSIFCSCRLDQFEAVLDDLKGQDLEVLLVEASGLSDPTNIRKILSQDKYQEIVYMGSICLADAVNFHKVYETARVSKKQIAVSDIVLINKTDLADREKIDRAKQTILAQRPDMRIYETAFGRIDPKWLSDLQEPVYQEITEEIQRQDLTLKKYLLRLGENVKKEQLLHFIRMFSEESYRIKGFVYLEDGLNLIDCVQNLVKISPYTQPTSVEQTGKIVVLSGAGMQTKKKIEAAMKWYPDLVKALEL